MVLPDTSPVPKKDSMDLTAARARLIGAKRYRMIAAYTLLSATGRLDVKTLGLKSSDYAPRGTTKGQPAHALGAMMKSDVGPARDSNHHNLT